MSVGIGRELRRDREKRGLTQTEMGELLGLERSYLSRLERDEAGISMETLAQIVKTLGWNRKPIGNLL